MIRNWKAFFICAGMLLFLSACAVKPQVRAVIQNNQLSSGAIQLERKGKVLDAVKGTKIEKGDIITTGPAEQALLVLENGAVEVTLFENTRIQISSIFAEYGELIVNKLKRVKGYFEVKSDHGIAKVRGTIFYVSVDRGVDFRVVGLQGVVDVSSVSGRTYRVTPKMDLLINSGATDTIDQQRTLNTTEFNNLVDRANRVQRIYRPGDASLLVPDVIGMQRKEAEAVLRQEGFRSIELLPILANGEIDTIVNTAPGPASIMKLSGRIVLSYAAKPTTMPGVVGQSESRARKMINSAGLNIGNVSYEITGNRKAGSVNRQNYSAGQSVAIGTRINLSVEAESVRVPSVEGSYEQSARSSISNAGLKVGRVDYKLTAGRDNGRVENQNPRAGERVEPGSEVDLTVLELGVRVPKVRDLSCRQARSVLERQGFYVAVYCRDESQPVLSQEPESGELVRKGDTVTLTVRIPRDIDVYVE